MGDVCITEIYSCMCVLAVQTRAARGEGEVTAGQGSSVSVKPGEFMQETRQVHLCSSVRVCVLLEGTV